MNFLQVYFVNTGLGWVIAGAMLAMALGGVGSALGIRIAGSQGAGVLSEKPDLFGKVIIFIAMPGTQGIYGLLYVFLAASWCGLLGSAKTVAISPVVGVCMFFVGIAMGLVLWRSAIHQGEAAAAAINLVARRADQFGRAIIMPALIETYAVFALLAALLMGGWLTAEGLKLADPETLLQVTRQTP